MVTLDPRLLLPLVDTPVLLNNTVRQQNKRYAKNGISDAGGGRVDKPVQFFCELSFCSSGIGSITTNLSG